MTMLTVLTVLCPIFRHRQSARPITAIILDVVSHMGLKLLLNDYCSCWSAKFCSQSCALNSLPSVAFFLSQVFIYRFLKYFTPKNISGKDGDENSWELNRACARDPARVFPRLLIPLALWPLWQAQRDDFWNPDSWGKDARCRQHSNLVYHLVWLW